MIIFRTKITRKTFITFMLQQVFMSNEISRKIKTKQHFILFIGKKSEYGRSLEFCNIIDISLYPHNHMNKIIAA